MKPGVVFTVFRKEMTDLLRDRRTLMSMVVLPVLVFPLLFGVMSRVMDQAEKKAETEATTVALGRETLPPAYRAAIEKSGLRIVEVDDARQAVEANKTSTGLRLDPQSNLVTVYAEGTRQASGIAADKLRSALGELRDTMVAERLRAANLEPSILRPFTVKRENVANERKMGGFILGSILGYIVILIMFSGGMYSAIDMSAGEKERKTMEALVASPASRTDIVLGKLFACVSATYLTALLTVSSLFLSLTRGGMGMKGMEKMTGNVPTDFNTIALLLIILLPVAVMAGSLMLAIALAARGFKEAQSYLTPLIMVVIFPALLGGLPGMELSPTLSLVPILNATQLIKAILQGDFPAVPFFITCGANVAYAAMCFAFAVRSFNDEKVIFRT
jgi:sodium transport system permease protein